MKRVGENSHLPDNLELKEIISNQHMLHIDRHIIHWRKPCHEYHAYFLSICQSLWLKFEHILSHTQTVLDPCVVRADQPIVLWFSKCHVYNYQQVKKNLHRDQRPRCLLNTHRDLVPKRNRLMYSAHPCSTLLHCTVRPIKVCGSLYRWVSARKT